MEAGKAGSNASNAFDITNTEGRRSLQFRVEIPVPSNDKKKMISPSIFKRSERNVETSILLGRPKPNSSSEERASANNSTSSIIGPSNSILRSFPDKGRAIIKSNNDSLSQTSKTLEHVPTALSNTQSRTGFIIVPQPANSKTMSSPHDKEGRTQEKATYEGRQTAVDGLRVVLPFAHQQSAPISVGTKAISDLGDDDEDGEDLLRKFQSPQSKRSTHCDIVYTCGKIILATIDHKATTKNDVESTGGTDFDDEDEILATTPAAPHSNYHRAQSRTQRNTQRRRQLLTTSNCTTTPFPDYLQVSDSPLALSALPSSKSSKPQKSPAYVSDTDSEDHLAADEQLLQDLRGGKTKVTEAAKSLLRRFQSQPSENSRPSSPPLKPLVHKETSVPSTKSKNHIKPAPTHRQTSMTSPFPIGKTIRRNTGPRSKEIPDTSASKTLAPPVESESESDFLSKKRKRNTFARTPRIAPRSDDPEAE